MWQSSGQKTFSNSHFSDITLPYDFYQDRGRYNAIREVESLVVPVLFIAGTKDTLVRPRAVKAIYDAAPEPKMLREFDTGHDYKHDMPMLEAINAATLDFFAARLSPSN